MIKVVGVELEDFGSVWEDELVGAVELRNGWRDGKLDGGEDAFDVGGLLSRLRTTICLC